MGQQVLKFVVFIVIFCLFPTPVECVEPEPEPPVVIFDSDFALPSIPVGDGSGTPVCVDNISGLLVAGCDVIITADQIDPSSVQKRVDGQCTVGSMIRAINPDGSVVCESNVDNDWTVSGDDMFSTPSGGVGIGTDAPEYPLHVASDGNGAVHGEMSGSVGSGVHGVANNSAAGLLSGVKGDAYSTTGRGVWGVAASSTGVNHGVYGMTFSNAGYGIHGHSVEAEGYAGYFEGGRNYFEGNVGIGTESPSAKLELGGADSNINMYEEGGSPFLGIGDNSTTVGWLQWNSQADDLTLYTYGHDHYIQIGPTTVGGLTVSSDTNDGNVGIGMGGFAPAAKLMVDSTADVDPFRVRVDGSTKFAVKRNGRTNVGSNTLPTYQLEITGEGTAGKPGGGSWSNSSDRRLKKNIQDLEGSLDRLLQLRSVTFEYIDPGAINELPGERIGMIAQEVEKVFPDWVGVGGHGYKTITYRGFEALTVEALRELRDEKDGQLAEKQRRIEQLEHQVAAMQSRLARLENLRTAEN